ncbi:hypothetical protein HPB50_015269 [Hyalomma asiaticum]|uniref:Uncharacterized protein n=1 Tax=Hyalomma asiaticum TaxID=266040 RepID=A0ACB7RL18_HYAAI|nr:hypothetical protein HPB50_015269 [Hyalomma asiaticum]
MTLLNVPERTSAAKTELAFPVELPPLGYTAYRITAQKKKEEMHFASASLEFLLLEPEQRFIENEVYDRQGLTSALKSDVPPAESERATYATQRYRLELDTTSGLVRRVTLLGQESGVSLRQSFYAYTVDAKRHTSATAGGAYSFEPDTNRPVDLGNKVTYRVVQGPFVTEVHQIFDQWLSQVIRLYKNSQFIEFEWIVGPLPSGTSTDVTTRYETSLDNDGVFFTDSNGMFTVTRRVNDSLDPTSVASSYYPVVSWIYIKNHAEELQMTVIPDRPQGGTSFVQGTIELMLHRRYFIDDDLGVDEPLNDRGVNDEGIVVKGRHLLHLGTPKHSELRVPLPTGGHLMTLEGTKDNQTLVRIENIHQDLTINLSITHLLQSFLLLDARETVLSAHQYRSEVQRRPWTQAEGKYVAPDESAYLMQQVQGNMLVNLQPGQIRTFLTTLKAFSLPPTSKARQ